MLIISFCAGIDVELNQFAQNQVFLIANRYHYQYRIRSRDFLNVSTRKSKYISIEWIWKLLVIVFKFKLMAWKLTW